MIETKTTANLFDLVEVVEDLPEYGVKSGERGAVVEVLNDPSEAYILEFADSSGTSSRLAYWVKPEQIRNISAVSEELYGEGTDFLKAGATLEGRRKLREAIRANPRLAGVLLNSVLESFGTLNDFERLIPALRAVCELSPGYQLARTNLVGAYLNRGIQQATVGDEEGALQLFYAAIGIEMSDDMLSYVKHNLAAAHTAIGIKAKARAQSAVSDEAALEDLRIASTNMASACAIDPNEHTRHNLGLAYSYLANRLLKNSQFEKAVAFFEVAENTGVSFPELHNNHGVALAFAGELSGAIEQFEAALELKPTHATARFNMAQVQQARSEGKGAACRIEEIGDFAFEDVRVSQTFEYQAAA